MGSELSKKFLVQVSVHQGPVLLPLRFAIAVDAITKNAREGLLNEIWYADNLVLMSESTKNLREKFLKWKVAFESKGLNINFNKTKVMVSGSKEEISKSKVYLCAKCGKRVMANSVLCTKCGKWVHGRCVKMETSTLTKGFICQRCVEAMKRILKPSKELTFHNQVKLVKSFCYLEDRLNAGSGSEAVSTARIKIK